MKCEECELEVATSVCTECDEILCLNCDSLIHRGGKRRSHQRFPVCNSCRSISSHKCQDCCICYCEPCRPPQSMHRTLPHAQSKSLAVFWDITLITSQNFSVIEGIKEITKQICKPTIIKLYSDCFAEQKTEENLEVISRFGIRALDALFLDLSVMINSGITHALIITSNLAEIQARVNYLKNCKFEIIIVDKIAPLEACGKGKGYVNLNFHCYTEFVEEFETVVEILKEEARCGRVNVEKGELIEKIMLKNKIGSDQASKLLDDTVKKGIFNVNMYKVKEKNFVFFSLRVEKISSEVVNWVIYSLKCDELTPNKKNIVNRLEKVFKLRVDKECWKRIKRKMCSKVRSLSCIDDKSMMIPSRGEFWPKGSRWKGLDSFKADVFNIKRTDIWDEFVEFCESYFSNHFKQSIPMGKFGLILILKYSGPTSLRYLSTGKLIYLINQSISEDLLRFNKTRLIWTNDFRILENTLYNELQLAKSSIISLISRSPLHICRLKPDLEKTYKISLNLPLLGYKKLKDLINSIPELKLKNGLIKLKAKKIPSHEQLKDLIESIVREKEYGITESVLNITLKSLLTYSVDWKDYNVGSIIDFIKQYSQHDIEILKTPECNILFKPNELKTYSYFFPFKHQFGSAMLESARVESPNIYHPINFSFEMQNTQKVQGSMHRVINISNIPPEVLKGNFKDEDEYCVDSFILDLSDVSISSQQFKSTQHSKNLSLNDWYIKRTNSSYLQEFDNSWGSISWVEI